MIGKLNVNEGYIGVFYIIFAIIINLKLLKLKKIVY